MPTTQTSRDQRIVMTLDAGGSSFRFSALRGGETITETLTTPSDSDQLDRCLERIRDGFKRVREQCPESPVAISFAFPGPADYPNGIIGDLPNLPAFRGGVALGPMLQDQFGIPVFINNDGDLFAFGEAIAGLLPWANGLLEKAGNPKRYKNLFGVTLGTGLGGGLSRNGELFPGDNSNASQVHLLRNKLDLSSNAEEGASIRAVRRVYAARAGIPLDKVPDPKSIFAIGTGASPGNREAAIEAFRLFGEVVGDVLAQALAIVDGLAVIGGGISGAAPLFLPALVSEMNACYITRDGTKLKRLTSTVFNLNEPDQLERFLRPETCEIRVPGTQRTVPFDRVPCTGVGMSRLGTSNAISIGAYTFALQQIAGS